MDLEKAKVPAAWVGGILAGAFSLYFWANSHYMPRAEAAETRKQDQQAIARKFLFHVQEAIANEELRKVDVKYDNTLSDQQRDEKLAAIERKLKLLRRREECHAEGNIECD